MCLVAQLCLTLRDPMEWSPPGSPVHGILQARILEWITMPSSRESSQPRDGTHVSCISSIGRQVFSHSATWEAPKPFYLPSKLLPSFRPGWNFQVLPQGWECYCVHGDYMVHLRPPTTFTKQINKPQTALPGVQGNLRELLDCGQTSDCDFRNACGVSY